MDLYGIYINLDILILVSLRITAFIFTCPLLGRKEIPSVTKIAISIFLSYILIVTGIPHIEIKPQGIGQFVLLCINETLRGMLIGYMSSIFFSIFTSAGKLIDTKIGFQMSEVFDPIYGAKTTITGNFINIAAFIVFIILNGHLHMIKILSDSYLAVPLGKPLDINGLFEIFISALSLSFLIAVKVALPIIIILLLTEGIMGMMIKFIPQMNIFVVGIPVKILIGLFALYFLITPMVSAFDNIFDSMYRFASSLY